MIYILNERQLIDSYTRENSIFMARDCGNGVFLVTKDRFGELGGISLDKLALVDAINQRITTSEEQKHTYRYTNVNGPDSNQFPALTWRFDFESDGISFRVARCSAEDNFSRVKGREIVDSRKPIGKIAYFSVDYSCGLVPAAMAFLLDRDDPLPHFYRSVLQDYGNIQQENLFRELSRDTEIYAWRT